MSRFRSGRRVQGVLLTIGLGLWCLAGLTGCGNPVSPSTTALDDEKEAFDRSVSVEAHTDDTNADETLEAGGGDSDALPAKGIRPAVTRENLDSWLVVFKDIPGWHYQERTPGELAGTWLSEDDDKHPLVFGADGTFKTGFVWRKGQGQMAEGKYAIADNGKIVAVAHGGTARICVHYQLDKGTIVGPKGPLPNARWCRVEAKTE